MIITSAAADVIVESADADDVIIESTAADDVMIESLTVTLFLDPFSYNR